MFGWLKKNDKKKEEQKTENPHGTLREDFFRVYAPYKIPGFVSEPRQELVEMYEQQKTMQGTLIASLERGRAKDPMIGAKAAGHEILLNMIRVLKNEKGVQIEALFSGLGCLAGYECSVGLMQALKEMAAGQADEMKLAGALGIMIVETKDGEHYLMGDCVGNTFFEYYQNAVNDTAVKPEVLLNQSSYAAMNVGKPQYWQTPYDKNVGSSPKEILDAIHKAGLDRSLTNYCRYPHERLMACALAAREALEFVQNGTKDEAYRAKQNAAEILKEYGWRTSHYIWKL